MLFKVQPVGETSTQHYIRFWTQPSRALVTSPQEETQWHMHTPVEYAKAETSLLVASYLLFLLLVDLCLSFSDVDLNLCAVLDRLVFLPLHRGLLFGQRVQLLAESLELFLLLLELLTRLLDLVVDCARFLYGFGALMLNLSKRHGLNLIRGDQDDDT